MSVSEPPPGDAPSKVHVLAVLSTLGAGGAERSTVESIEPLRERGIELDVAVLDRVDEGVEEFAARRSTVHHVEGRNRIAKVVELRALIRRLGPDVVHTAIFEADLIGRLAAWRTHTPVMSSLINTSYDRIRRSDPAVRRSRLEAARLLDSLTAKRLTNHFHAISRASKKAGVDHLGIEPDDVTVVPRGRHRDRLGGVFPERRAESRRRLGLDESDVVILNVGRQEWQKGQDVLLRAAAELVGEFPSLRVVIAGREGNATARLQDLTAQHGLTSRVRYLGHVDDVGGTLAAADVFAFPSRYEGLGGALLEAMAMGVPIVTTDCPATAEAVGDAALTVPVDEASALADAVRQVLTDADLRRTLSTRGVERFEALFEFERVMDEMADLYRHVAGAPPTHSGVAE